MSSLLSSFSSALSSVLVRVDVSRLLCELLLLLGRRYDFDSSEAMLYVCENASSLSALSLVSSSSSSVKEKVRNKSVKEKVVKEKVVKSKVQLPFQSESATRCRALQFNGGLYTQCESVKPSSGGSYCSKCEQSMLKLCTEVPVYGTVESRVKEKSSFVDPKGRKPVHYSVWLKKHSVTREMVLAEALKQGIELSESHFESPPTVKRGRPSTKSATSPAKPKGKKGRPRTVKVVEVSAPTTDLFAALEEDDVEVVEEEEKEEEEKEEVEVEEEETMELEEELEVEEEEKEEKEVAIVVPVPVIEKKMKKCSYRNKKYLRYTDESNDNTVFKCDMDERGNYVPVGKWVGRKVVFDNDDSDGTESLTDKK